MPRSTMLTMIRAEERHATPTLAFDSSILAGQLAPSSISMYARDFRAYLAYARTPAAALDPATLARWRALLAANTSLSPNTINRMLSAVKRLIKEAAVQGYVPHETAKAFADIAGVKVVALKERTKRNGRTRIDPAAIRQLCEAPDQTTMKGLRDAAMLATLASSGLRVSELASLTLGQITKKGNGYMLSVRGKNDREYREAPLSREAYRLLMQWITRRPVVSEYVFTSFGGRGQRATQHCVGGNRGAIAPPLRRWWGRRLRTQPAIPAYHAARPARAAWYLRFAGGLVVLLQQRWLHIGHGPRRPVAGYPRLMELYPWMNVECTPDHRD